MVVVPVDLISCNILPRPWCNQSEDLEAHLVGLDHPPVQNLGYCPDQCLELQVAAALVADNTERNTLPMQRYLHLQLYLDQVDPAAARADRHFPILVEHKVLVVHVVVGQEGRDYRAQDYRVPLEVQDLGDPGAHEGPVGHGVHGDHEVQVAQEDQ